MSAETEHYNILYDACSLRCKKLFFGKRSNDRSCRQNIIFPSFGHITKDSNRSVCNWILVGMTKVIYIIFLGRCPFDLVQLVVFGTY